MLVVGGACGWKEREPHLSRFVFPSGQGAAEEKVVESGFAKPIDFISVDQSYIWAAADTRIKAFSPEDGTLKHTLNSHHYKGPFGLAEEFIFRAGSKGQFAKWAKAELDNHGPVWEWGDEVSGRLVRILKQGYDKYIPYLRGMALDPTGSFWNPKT